MMKKYTGLLKLSALGIVLPWIVWEFALKGTVKLWKRYEGEKARMEQLGERRLPGETVVAEKYENELVLAEGKLLDEMAKSVRQGGIGVVRYVPVVLYREGKYVLYAGELVLSGSYAGLLRWLEDLRKKIPSVKVVSASFRLYREKYGDRPDLRLTLVLVQLGMDHKN